MALISEILSIQDLVEELLSLLSRTVYPREQMESYVNRLGETFKWEGVPYVEIDDDYYIVTIYERGVPSLTRKLKQTEEVLYWLLEDMIFTAAHVNLLKKYGVDNVHTHLDYTSEVWQEIENNVRAAFENIGEPYLSWHLGGKRHELESYQPRKKGEQ